jgi:hypothetical protein
MAARRSIGRYYPAPRNNLLNSAPFIPICGRATLSSTQLAAETLIVKRQFVTLAALIALAATAFGAVQVTAQENLSRCIPPAVIQALS